MNVPLAVLAVTNIAARYEGRDKREGSCKLYDSMTSFVAMKYERLKSWTF